jgi:hypothetical protein
MSVYHLSNNGAKAPPPLKRMLESKFNAGPQHWHSTEPPSCQQPSFCNLAQSLEASVSSWCWAWSEFKMFSLLGFSVIFFPLQAGVAETFWISIREAPGSNICRVTQTIVYGFPRTFQVNANTSFKSVIIALLPKLWLFITHDHHLF